MSVQWNPKRERFELEVDGKLAIADCIVRPDEWVVTHVEVPNELRGGGVASRLAAGIVEHAREKQGKITPVCSFMVAYFQRHPEARDVLSY
ncbi:N-acetyltransferase [bacterium]|nr:MAG: N-acetyltransferase [bacterium]